jgi:putative tricarboxylic transport membrane protein
VIDEGCPLSKEKTMNSTKIIRTTVAVAAVSLTLTACGGAESGGTDSGEEFEPGATEFMVHTGPGGGSDVFAREVTALLEQEELVDQSSWTVRNEEGGSGASAMAFLRRLSGESETIGLTTPTWLTTPLTTPEAAVTMDQLTPIARLINEPMVMAVKADSEYQELQDFIDAAEAEPGGMVQAGGSVTSVDAIAGEIIMAETGTDWAYLSYEGGGERITALLNGDADMMFGSPSDFTEQVRAGDLRVIATIGDEAPALFPEAKSLPDSGVDVDVPQQVRGLAGPPDMPAEAVEYYENLFEELTQTEAWAQYVEDNGMTTVFAGGEEFGTFLEEQNELLRAKLDELGLLGA